ncbi:MAG: hypothetical protein K1X57_21105 [Gemmataceae bacterium]|nr:hypothetical protein [Gemmataceae bacterium]
MSSAGTPVTTTDRSGTSPFFEAAGTEPLRGEIFGQAYLEEYARQLARASTESMTVARRSIYERLRDDDRLLREAHAAIRTASHGQETLTTDAEWLLDNFFVVEDVLREVTRDLPVGYYSELPRLTVGPLAGYPRILALAIGLVAHSDSSLSESQIRDFVKAYQAEKPLTIGELWAVPTMLRLALVENLRRLAQQMITTREDKEYALTWVAAQGQEARGKREIRPPERKSDATLVAIVQGLRDLGVSAQPIVTWLDAWLEKENTNAADLLRRENRRQAVNQVSVGNCITSLRLLNALDWNAFVEQTSHVEAILRSDPTGIYPRQDFQTRDRCRQIIERIGRRSSCSEVEVAKKVTHLAAAGSDDRRRQVAYYLLDAGRPELETAAGYRPTLGDRKRSLFRRSPSPLYFGLIALFLLATVFVVAELSGARRYAALAVIAAVFLPASELAVGLVNLLMTRWVPPTTLPKLDPKDGIPAGFGAFVVMPSMLTKAESAAHLLERLELHYLANPDPQLRFALLTDFADSATETMPTDRGFADSAMKGVEQLNRKYAEGGPDIFFVFHRRRQWNPSEGKWMGWERKRGKLLEFNRLLRGATDTSYAWQSGKIADPEQYRYVITLDTDTNLPRETARRMICTLAHPLNRAVPDATHTKVVAGYAILQPRMSFLFQTGSRSRFARTLASSAGIDPYQVAISDVYMDLFGRGSFIGKGIYDVDAFEAVTGPAFPENRILSHDLIESNYARCALATDMELLDEFPARYHAYARRDHRWIRGDWQLLPWLMPRVPCNVRGQEGRRPNTLDMVERWKVLDNLRRSLVGVSVVLMVALGWTVLPGSPWLWTVLAIMVAGWPLVIFLINSLWGVLKGTPAVTLRAARGSLPGTAMQSLFSTGFLLDQSRHALNAIGITLYRLFVSRKHLLEWETAAATEQRLGENLGSFVATMFPTSLIAIGLGVLVAVAKPAALPAALPLVLLWTLSPVLAWWVSQPLPVKVTELTETDRKALRRIARKTWGFFETFVGPEDNWLPPDNFQEDPKGEVAHRTSPTNKGLLVLSTLAAHDFGYISMGRMAERLNHTFDTFDKLEKHRGHILNWYDTRTLEPLHPA